MIGRLQLPNAVEGNVNCSARMSKKRDLNDSKHEASLDSPELQDGSSSVISLQRPSSETIPRDIRQGIARMWKHDTKTNIELRVFHPF